MRAVVQRVKQASVSVAGEEISRIGAGFLVLLAVKVGDSGFQAQKMAEKIARLRIIEDANEKMNLSLHDQGQSILLVSQFTLYGDLSGGNRPSFIAAARPEEAKPLIEAVASILKQHNLTVETGAFGKHMEISLINDGPTTIILET